MTFKRSRRRFAQILPLGLALPLTTSFGATPRAFNFRIRTLTAGLQMTVQNWNDEAFGDYHSDWKDPAARKTITALDQFALDHDLMLSIGPVISADEYHPEFADWAVEIIRETSNNSFSLNTVCLCSNHQCASEPQGTGLDVVPIPGDSSPTTVANILSDVASLATRYRKPLSARLFPAPGLKAGETVRFDNSHLTDAVLMSTQ